MRALATIPALVLVAACQTAPPQMTDAETAQIETAVLEVAEAIMDGLRQLDPDVLASTAHPDLLTWAAGGQVVGRAGYRDVWAKWMEGRENLEGDWVDTRVRVLSPDLAVFSGTIEYTTRFANGRTFHHPSGAFAFLLERTAEGWKCTVGGSSAGPARPVEEG